VEPPNITTVLPTTHMVWAYLALGHASDAPDAEVVNTVQ
jgi:hypothetical protein